LIVFLCQFCPNHISQLFAFGNTFGIIGWGLKPHARGAVIFYQVQFLSQSLNFFPRDAAIPAVWQASHSQDTAPLPISQRVFVDSKYSGCLFQSQEWRLCLHILILYTNVEFV